MPWPASSMGRGADGRATCERPVTRARAPPTAFHKVLSTEPAVIAIFGQLRAKDVAACTLACRALHQVAVIGAPWEVLCEDVWQDKVFVPGEARRLKAAGDGRAALQFAHKDKVRTVITLEELVGMIWQSKEKPAVGRGGLAASNWRNGRHCIYTRYNVDGTIDRETYAYERDGHLRPRPWLATHPLPHGPLLKKCGTWVFPEQCGDKLTGPKGAFLRAGLTKFNVAPPTRAFVRHPHNWVSTAFPTHCSDWVVLHSQL